MRLVMILGIGLIVGCSGPDTDIREDVYTVVKRHITQDDKARYDEWLEGQKRLEEQNDLSRWKEVGLDRPLPRRYREWEPPEFPDIDAEGVKVEFLHGEWRIRGYYTSHEPQDGREVRSEYRATVRRAPQSQKWDVEFSKTAAGE